MANRGPLNDGVYYHIFNRGNNREDIFAEPENYRYFLALYTKHIEPVAETFAYCLLRNHFHLLVRIRQDVTGFGNLSRLTSPPRAFANLFNAYAKAMNNRYGRTGSLFQRPFGRIPVESDDYLAQLVYYIHLNPQRHGFVSDFRKYPYSSYHALCSSSLTHLKRDKVLDWFGGKENFVLSHLEQINDQRITRVVGDD